MNELEVYDLYRRGSELLERGDFAAAAVPLTRARELEPDKASIREALGRALFHSQRYREAAEEFGAARRALADRRLRALLPRPRAAACSAAIARPAARSRSPPACAPTAASTAHTAIALARRPRARASCPLRVSRSRARRSEGRGRRCVRLHRRSPPRKRPRRLLSARSGEAMLAALHALLGMPAARLALEVHLDRRAAGSPLVWFAVRCPPELARQLQAALRRELAERASARAPRGRRCPTRGACGCCAGASRAATELVRSRWTGRSSRCSARWRPPARRRLVRPGAAPCVAHRRAGLRPRGRADQTAAVGRADRVRARPRARARDRERARGRATAAGDSRAERRSARAARRCALSPVRSSRGLWCLPAPEFAALPCVRRAVPLAPAPPGHQSRARRRRPAARRARPA